MRRAILERLRTKLTEGKSSFTKPSYNRDLREEQVLGAYKMIYKVEEALKGK
ncbi:MAG: hypothetical protein N2260_01910 [Syntrophobacterales bacterium]|nr:hypothetical protein [Syntrophobacterales bacterium]